MSNSFKSYVDIDEQELQSLSTSGEESLDPLAPRLLPGEVTIAEAQNVLMFVPLSEQKQGRSGTLVVTNFKLSFTTTEDVHREDVGYQQNYFLGEHEVCLSNVDQVFQITGDKKKKLLPGKNVPGKVSGLQVVCKTMRVLTFSFKFSPVGHGKTLTNALLHHAFPRRHQLLFAYDYREPSYHNPSKTGYFRDQMEWVVELKRTSCPGWRVSIVNDNYELSPNLPQYIVVPESVLDWQLGDAARHFRGGRPPVWCWGTSEGAALVRMADILPTINDRVQENVMLEHIRKTHPNLRQPVILDLHHLLPSPKDVQISFAKLRDLCSPDTVRQFWMQDSHFSSLLEASKWLHTVTTCLQKASEAADQLQSGTTIVLQEGEGRDMSAVISSLVQLILDPYWRTIEGFQLLVQKEWVALGHPFCLRLSYVLAPEGEQSPIFLVFLDCVWQMLQQFPTAFEFTETYLTTLWDSIYMGIFDTFLFNCERERKIASSDHNNPLHLRSVWDWEEQFTNQDIALFKNVLYTITHQLEEESITNGVNPLLAMETNNFSRLRLNSNHRNSTPMKRSSMPASVHSSMGMEVGVNRWTLRKWPVHKVLPIKFHISDVEVWHQCYYRWLPTLEIPGGGPLQINFQFYLLVEEITHLQRKLSSLQKGSKPLTGGAMVNCVSEASIGGESSQIKTYLQSNLNSFFPFSHGGITDQRPGASSKCIELMFQSSFLFEEDMCDSQSLLNAPD